MQIDQIYGTRELLIRMETHEARRLIRLIEEHIKPTQFYESGLGPDMNKLALLSGAHDKSYLYPVAT